MPMGQAALRRFCKPLGGKLLEISAIPRHEMHLHRATGSMLGEGAAPLGLRCWGPRAQSCPASPVGRHPCPCSRPTGAPPRTGPHPPPAQTRALGNGAAAGCTKRDFGPEQGGPGVGTLRRGPRWPPQLRGLAHNCSTQVPEAPLNFQDRSGLSSKGTRAPWIRWLLSHAGQRWPPCAQ